MRATPPNAHATRLARHLFRAAQVTLLLVAVCALFSSAARAERPTVLARLVRIAVTSNDPHYQDEFAGIVDEVLGPILEPTRGPARIGGFAIQATLGGLVQERRDSRVHIRCEVSVLVSDARGGALRYALSGQARAAGTGDLDRLRVAVIRAALRGAVRPLVEQRLAEVQ